MGSGMLDEFVSRKHARSKVRFDHPSLEPLLADTYGIIVYQEQVMQIAQVLAGYSPGQADVLRKAMGKKIPEILQQQKETFMKGMRGKEGGQKDRRKGLRSGRPVRRVWVQQKPRVGLRVRELSNGFFKGELSRGVYDGGVDVGNRPFGLGLKGSGIENGVLHGRGPRHGHRDFAARCAAVRGCFSVESPPRGEKGAADSLWVVAVKNVGEGAVASMLEARKKGPFASLGDLCARVDTRQSNRKVLESLVKAGAFDGFRPVLGEESDAVRMAELCRWRAQMLADVEGRA
jgi:DNA polymerase-3 subunit alpha